MTEVQSANGTSTGESAGKIPEARVWPFFRGRRLELAAIGALSAAAGLAEALFLVVITNAALSLANESSSVALPRGLDVSLPTAGVIAMAVVLARTIFAASAATRSAALSASMTATLRMELADAFMKADWRVQHEDPQGRLQELLTTFTQRGTQLVTGVTAVLRSGFNLAVLLLAAIVVDFVASLAVVAGVAILGSCLKPVRGAVKRRARAQAKQSMEFATALNEVSRLGMELHIFGVQDEVRTRISRRTSQLERSARRLLSMKSLVPVLYSGLAYVAVTAAVIAIGYTEAADVATLGVVLLVMLRSLSYAQAVQVSLAEIGSSLPFLASFNEEVARYQSASFKGAGLNVTDICPITLTEVAFEYQPNRPVLHGVTALIRPREVVGIIGPSGSGKSTLVQLLLGLREPSSGEIVTPSGRLSDLDRNALARKVAFVPQESRLISGTVADNVRFFRPLLEDERLEEACALANIHDEILAMPGGYSADVGDGGSRLSGGQRQRLAIARALAGEPELIVLDEPTSALDMRSEHLVRETLRGLRNSVTVIIVAHRLSTLDICDRLMVIQDGLLVGFDVPAVLESTNPFYREVLELSGLR